MALIDADMARTHARFSTYDPVGDYIPDSDQVASSITTDLSYAANLHRSTICMFTPASRASSG